MWVGVDQLGGQLEPYVKKGHRTNWGDQRGREDRKRLAKLLNR